MILSGVRGRLPYLLGVKPDRAGGTQHMIDPEIDIVLPRTGLIFEIKYTDNISENTVQRVAQCAKKENFTPFIVTEDVFDTRESSDVQVRLIPLWFLCLTNLY